MLLNYLKLALRLLIRNPFYTFINVLGLSVGFAVFFVLSQYSRNELKSDQFHKDYERIVRCGFVWRWTDDNINWVDTRFGVIWPEIADKVARDFVEIEELTRVFHQENFTPEHIPQHGKVITLNYINAARDLVTFNETGVVYADRNLFQFFGFPLLKGNPESVLKLANSVVLSASTAKKYFGDEDPIGKTMTINNEISLLVTGIFKDLPKNSHLAFSIVISTAGILKNISKAASAPTGPYSYLRLRKGTDAKALEEKMNQVRKAYLDGKIPAKQIHMVRPRFALTPLKEIAFSKFMDDFFKPKSKFFLNTLNVISLVVLVMAWINYMNLTLSANIKRMKEIAVRKTSGANRLELITQFVLEAMIINIFSFCLAITIIQLTTTFIAYFFGFYILDLASVSFSTIVLWSAIGLAGILATGVLPCLIALKKTPRTLFSSWKTDGKSYGIKNILMTFQFTIAIVLIVWVCNIYLQLNEIIKADIGLYRQEVMLLDLPVHRKNDFDKDVTAFLNAMRQVSEIRERTLFTSITGDPNAGYTSVCLRRTEASNVVCVDTNGGVDEGFIPFFKIKILAGRNFLADAPSNPNHVILSKRALERIGISNTEEAIGLKILINRNHWAAEKYSEVEIIGVIDDYSNRALMASSGQPGIILTYKDILIPGNKPHKVAFRVQGNNIAEGISSLEKVYSSFFPGEIFHCHFLNDQINGLYINEKISRNQILLLSGIAIIIACLGLLGMIQYKVVEKTKELGIRKVLGASIYHLGAILLGGMVRQIIFAVIIAIPVAAYLTDQYIQNFSVRTPVEFWHYVAPVGILLVIMCGTITSVLWKAARTNPVESLRYE
jgi:putative ABC transport system permease protein